MESKGSFMLGKLSRFAGKNELWKMEWKYWLSRLGLLQSVLAAEELKLMMGEMLLDFAMDFKYLNILLLLIDDALLAMRLDL